MNGISAEADNSISLFYVQSLPKLINNAFSLLNGQLPCTQSEKLGLFLFMLPGHL